MDLDVGNEAVTVSERHGMTRQMRIALMGAGSALLLIALVLGFMPADDTYQLDGMIRPMTTDCGSPIQPSGVGDTVGCITGLETQGTWAVIVGLAGLGLLAVSVYFTYWHSSQEAEVD